MLRTPRPEILRLERATRGPRESVSQKDLRRKSRMGSEVCEI
jgi:hypothetical protein